MSYSRQPVIGYLVKTFPKLSETFILNEILELERQGVKLHIFSLRSPNDAVHHPAVAQVKSPVTYIPSILPQTSAVAKAALLEAQVNLSQHFALCHPNPVDAAIMFHHQRPEAKELNEIWQAIYLAQEMQRLNIVHLHVHFANIPTATAEMAQIICGVPYSITAHAKDIYLTDSDVLDRRMAKAEFVLTCTDFNRQYLQRISRSDTPIHLAYHGIDLKRFTSLSSTLPTTRERLPERAQSAANPVEADAVAQPVRLLSVGRFCEKKGFDYLLKACRLLWANDLNFTCTLVGYGPLQSQIEQWIDAYQLHDVVTLAGKLTQDQVLEQYRQADAFVLPCVVMEDGDRDGIPNVLLEAMATGLPVVSTDISGIGELVQSGHNGLLVPERNEVALADALQQLMADAQWRSQLGLNGQQTVRQRFALAQNVGDVKDLLLQTLTRQTRQPSRLQASAHATLQYVDQLENALL